VDQSSRIFLFNAGGVVVHKAVYRLSISLSIPEIFALKVESCPKSRRILDVFRYTAIPLYPKVVQTLSAPLSITSRDKVSLGYSLLL